MRIRSFDELKTIFKVLKSKLPVNVQAQDIFTNNPEFDEALKAARDALDAMKKMEGLTSELIDYRYKGLDIVEALDDLADKFKQNGNQGGQCLFRDSLSQIRELFEELKQIEANVR